MGQSECLLHCRRLHEGVEWETSQSLGARWPSRKRSGCLSPADDRADQCKYIVTITITLYNIQYTNKSGLHNNNCAFPFGTQALDRRIAELNDAEEQAKCKALQDNASVSSLGSLVKTWQATEAYLQM